MTAPNPLVPAEPDLLAMLASGMSAAEIGRRTYAAERTVQKRVAALKVTAGARNTTQLVVTALIPRQPQPDPQQCTDGQALVALIAARHADTQERIAQRRADMLADLDTWQARRRASYRNPRVDMAKQDDERPWGPSDVLRGAR